MLYLMIAFSVILFFLLKPKRICDTHNTEDIMFAKELDSIKSDTVLNFIDEKFLSINFELLCNFKYFMTANDNVSIDYPITTLQDLNPLNLA